ncbi:MAG: hypothetical protein LUG91_00160 [Ruminococcus sp.]|nr:hypothetical protein [Ruminococcus sp.]
MKKKTNEEFLQQMKEINPQIKILEPYQKDNIKVHCMCLKCGYEWNSTPSNLLQGKGCKMCHFHNSSKTKSKGIGTFIKELSIVQPNIKVVGSYINSSTKISCLCLKHNETFCITPHHLLDGKTGCHQCIEEKWHNSGLKTHEKFVTELNQTNSYIKVLGKYNGSKSKVEVQCVKCGYVWSPIADSLLRGYGCPRCNISKGELAIERILTDKGITYQPQKKFENLVGVGKFPLSYDFYIKDFNLLIEFQGIQHEKPNEHFGKEYFETQKEHDKRKREYAIYNGYNYLEIWYYDIDNIENIIGEKLQEIKESRNDHSLVGNR